MKKFKWIYDEAFKLNTPKNKFLIWGTCLGFETILHAASNYTIKTIEVDTLNTPKKIKWVKPAFDKSDFAEVLRPEVAQKMEDEPNSYFSHHWGFDMDDFDKVESLKNNFYVIAYYEKNGKKIIAAFQHKLYPIIGVQFHPEKILYEHKQKVHINLTKSSVMESQELSTILFNYSFENHHRFKDRKILDILEFKNFNSKKTNTVFETVYAFKKDYFMMKNLLNCKDNLSKQE